MLLVGIVHERVIKFLLNDRNKSRNLQSFGDFWTKSCQFLINNDILWSIWSFFTGLLSFNWILWWETNVIRKLITILWRKRTMHPEKIHFPLSTLGPVQEWDAFFLLPSIYALFESVYGKKKKKALPLLHCARSGKREMYFFWAHCPFSPHGGNWF